MYTDVNDDVRRESELKFRINTLRRRLDFLIKKLETSDSANARRFNQMEIEALEEAINALENRADVEAVGGSLVSLVTALGVGDVHEIGQAISASQGIIDRYQL